MDISWKFRLTFRLENYIWSLPLWIWTQMRHLGTLIPRFCTEFRYESYGQSGLAWGAIFEKKNPNMKNSVFFFFKTCMSVSSGNRFPTWVFSQSHTGSHLGWSFSISRFTGYIRMLGFSVFPDIRVIPKWLDFQYFQIHGSLKWLTTQTHIFFT